MFLGIRACIYVSTYVRTYVCVYVCAYLSVCLCMTMHVLIFTCTYVCTYVFIYVCVYVLSNQHFDTLKIRSHALRCPKTESRISFLCLFCLFFSQALEDFAQRGKVCSLSVMCALVLFWHWKCGMYVYVPVCFVVCFNMQGACVLCCVF